MTKSDYSRSRAVRLLKSPFPWRQLKGLKLCLSGNEKDPDVLPHLFSLLTSRWAAVREASYRVCETLGDAGAELMLVCALGTGGGNANLLRQLDQLGYGLKDAIRLLAGENPIARRFACRQIIANARSGPGLLASAYVEQALRFLPLTVFSPFVSQRARATDGTLDAELYAALLTAVSEEDAAVADALAVCLGDERPDARKAIYKAWGMNPTLGKRRLIKHALSELDPNLQAFVAESLKGVGGQLRDELVSHLTSTGTRGAESRPMSDAARRIALLVVSNSPDNYGDQLENLAALLLEPGEDIREAAATAFLGVIDVFTPTRRVGRRTEKLAIVDEKRVRQFSKSLATMSASADSWSDRMMGLLVSENALVRCAALKVLDLVALSTTKARQDQIAQAAGFATLGEANNRNKKLLEDLLRRLHGGREDNDGTLGFQIAA